MAKGGRSRSRSGRRAKSSGARGKSKSRKSRAQTPEDEVRKTQNADLPGTSAAATGGGDREDEDEDDEALVMPEPIVSPRDPNHYRILKLTNGMTVTIISTLGYAAEEAAMNLANRPVDPCEKKKSETSVFRR
jgi:hypothetical protein